MHPTQPMPSVPGQGRQPSQGGRPPRQQGWRDEGPRTRHHERALRRHDLACTEADEEIRELLRRH